MTKDTRVTAVNSIEVHRIPVPGGWLYLSRLYSSGGLALASTFVPETEKGSL